MRLLLLLSLLVFFLPASAEAARDRCAPRDDEEVFDVTSRLKVLNDSEQVQYVVCYRATGRRTELYFVDEKYGSGRVVATRGRWIAHSYTEVVGCPIPDCGEPPEVTAATSVVTDARTGRRRVLSDTAVVPFRLSSDGVVAWLTGTGTTRDLHVWDATGSRILDTGPLRLADLRVAGSRVRWINAGTTRSAAARPLGR